MEVDIEGDPLPTMHTTPTAESVQDNSNYAPPPPSSTNLDSLDNIILAKFLTVVVSRVPEISSALADLLPEGSDPLLFQRAFPDDIDVTLAELRSIREHCAKVADNSGRNLHGRATHCIATIEP